jgi:hypothetical protein
VKPSDPSPDDPWSEVFIRGFQHGFENGRAAGWRTGLLRAVDEADKLLGEDILTAPLFGKLAVILMAARRNVPEE